MFVAELQEKDLETSQKVGSLQVCSLSLKTISHDTKFKERIDILNADVISAIT